MLKAILLVTALGGGGDYSVEMPSMNECLDARTTIAEQDSNVKTLCVPMADDTAKVQEFFMIFMDMIDQIKAKDFPVVRDDEYQSPIDGYVCDSSVEPGVVIHTFPPKINCIAPWRRPPGGWAQPKHPLFKEQVILLTDLVEEQMNRRIGLAYDVRQAVKSEWGKLYWDNVLAYLLRQANRLD